MKNIPVIDKLFSRDIVWWHFGCATAVIVVVDMILSDTPFFTPLQFFKWLLFGGTVWALLSLTSRRGIPDTTERSGSQEEYVGLLEQASDGVIVFDRQGDIISANAGAQSLLGQTSQTLSSINVADILSDDELCRQPLRLTGLFEGTPLSGERWMRRKSGGSFAVEISARQIEPDQVTMAIRDLSKRKKAEDSLRKNEQYYRALVDNAATASVLIGDDGSILYGSPAVETLLGYTSAEVVGQPALQFLHPDEVAQIQEKLSAFRKTPESVKHFELRLVHKDGSFRTVEGRAKSTVGSPHLNGTLLTFHDNTDRRNREEELQLFHTAMEQTEAGILLFEVREGAPEVIVYTNPAWSRLSGDKPGETVGQTVDPVFTDPAVATALRESLLDGLTRSGDSTFAYKNAIQVPIEWSILPLRDADNRITHVMYTVRNISEQQQINAALMAAKEQAEQNNRFKTALFDTLNREFRTPMHGLLGLSEVLAQDLPDTGYRQLAAMLHTDAEHVMSALNTTLMLAGVVSGSASDEHTPVDVKTAVETLLDKYRVSARDKGIKLYFDTVTDEVVSTVDPLVLHEVMTTLLGNAFQFTHKGSITVQVFTGEYNDSLHAAVRVIDTGMGMSREFLPHLFEEFSREQTATPRLYEGSGLGLVFVQRLLGLVRGGVTVESEQGRGSIFTIYLPLVDGAALLPDPIVLPEHPAILFVGNTFSDTGVLLERSLDGIATIVGAEGGAAAVEQASQRQYNLVLVDTTFGNIIDPGDIIAALHSIPGYTSIPAVALTDCTSDRDTEYLLQAGFTECLTKPFDHRQLLGTIVRCLTAQETE